MTTRVRSRARLVVVLVGAVLAACGGPPTESPGGAANDPGSWRRHDLGVTGPRIHAVTPGGPGFIGVGAMFPGDDTGSGIYSSPDAETWSVVDAPRAGRSLVAVVQGGPGFVAASSAPAAIWTSRDGLAWTESAPTATFGETTILTFLAATGGQLFAGTHDGLLLSTDGSEWQRTDLGGPGTVTSVVQGGPGFVAVGSTLVGSMESRGTVWTSADGRAWQRQPDAPVFDRAGLYAVGEHEGLLVAIGHASDPPGGGNLFARPSAWTSRDGTTWERAEVVDTSLPVRATATGALEGALMTSIARTGSGWIAAGTALTAQDETMEFAAAIWTSSDGVGWQRVPHTAAFVAGHAAALQFGAFSLSASGDRVVVVGRATGPQTTLWINE